MHHVLSRSTHSPLHTAPSEVGGGPSVLGRAPSPPPVATAAVHCGSCGVAGLVAGWARLMVSPWAIRQAGWLGLRSPHCAPARRDGAAAAEPLVLALGAAAVLGSVPSSSGRLISATDGSAAGTEARPGGPLSLPAFHSGTSGTSASRRSAPSACSRGGVTAARRVGGAGAAGLRWWARGRLGVPETLETAGRFCSVLCCAL